MRFLISWALPALLICRRHLRLLSVLLVLIAVPVAPGAGVAQEDLGFEQGELSDAWVLGGSKPEYYEAGVDPDTVMGGSGSGFIRQTTYSDEYFGSLSQRFAADEVRGRRLQLVAWVKTSINRGEASLWMRVDGPERTVLRFDNMVGRRVMRTSDWTMNVIILDVPPDAEWILFGLLLLGDGTAWVDSIRFQVVGEDVPVTGRPIGG